MPVKAMIGFGLVVSSFICLGAINRMQNFHYVLKLKKQLLKFNNLQLKRKISLLKISAFLRISV